MRGKPAVRSDAGRSMPPGWNSKPREECEVIGFGICLGLLELPGLPHSDWGPSNTGNPHSKQCVSHYLLLRTLAEN